MGRTAIGPISDLRPKKHSRGGRIYSKSSTYQNPLENDFFDTWVKMGKTGQLTALDVK